MPTGTNDDFIPDTPVRGTSSTPNPLAGDFIPDTQISAGPGWIGRNIVQPWKDFTGGAAASYNQLGVGAYNLARKALPFLPPPSAAVNAITEPPPGAAGKLGELAGTLSQFMIPSGVVGRGVKAVEAASAGTKAARILPKVARVLGEAGSAGAVEGVRTGGDVERAGTAALLGGAGAGLAEAGKAAAPFLIRTADELVGKMTGAGKMAGRQATEKFNWAMRKPDVEREIVRDLENATKKVASDRAAAYTQQFDQLDQGIRLDLSGTRAELPVQLEKWGAKMGRGGLDFSQSTITSKADRDLLRRAWGDVISWRDMSPKGVDTLKQRLNSYATDASPQVAPFFHRLGESVRSNLEMSVPGYKELTADYAKASQLLNDVRRELSAGAANPGVTINKLANIFSRNNDYRRILLESLDKASGSDLANELAGFSHRSLLPRGLMGVASASPFAAAAYLGHPGMLPGLVFSSPRIVGEAISLLSVLSRKTPAAVKAAAKAVPLSATLPAGWSAGWSPMQSGPPSSGE